MFYHISKLHPTGFEAYNEILMISLLAIMLTVFREL